MCIRDRFCPVPTVRTPVMSAVVFDASAHMVDSASIFAKEDAHAFVDLLDGSTDSVGVFWFQQNDTLMQDFTPQASLLHAAITPAPATGSAALWDAVYAAVEGVALHVGNSRRMVLVFSNGVDDASSHNAAECIALANQTRIRIFTFGYGANVQGTVLRLSLIHI